MIERFGDVWCMDNIRYLCIPINGSLARQSKLVMGAGIAREARDLCAGLNAVAGVMVKAHGLRVMMMSYAWSKCIILFPTKYEWTDSIADLALIELSCMELKVIAKTMPGTNIALPRPGCGIGGLDWITQVKPVVAKHLGDLDNIVIVTKEYNTL